MESNYKNIKELIEYSKGGILSKVIFKDGKTDITLFCLGDGTEIAEHTSTRQGFVFVLEGDGIFKLENEEIEMKNDVIIFLKKNVVHSIKVSKNTSFILCLYN